MKNSDLSKLQISLEKTLDNIRKNKNDRYQKEAENEVDQFLTGQ